MRVGFGVRQMVEVSVMSASGETQTSKTSFPLTKEDLQLALQGPIPCVKDSLPPFMAEVRTAAGALYAGSVEVTADLFLLEKHRRTKKFICQPTVRCGLQSCPPFPLRITSGWYGLWRKATQWKPLIELGFLACLTAVPGTRITYGSIA